MAVIRRWLDRARDRFDPRARTPVPVRTWRGGWFTERRDRNGNPTLSSRNMTDAEWSDDDETANRPGWLNRGTAARRHRKLRL